MSSVTQDPWLTDHSQVDDIGVVELFLKSLDSSEDAGGGHNPCWSAPLVGTGLPTSSPNASSKVGYEPFSLSQDLGKNINIKKEPCDDDVCCLQSSGQFYPETLDVGTQCPTSVSSLPDFPNFHVSAQLQGFGQTFDDTSDNWLHPPSYSSNFDSLKVVPELLVERLYQEDVIPVINQHPVKHHVKVEQVQPTYLCNQIHCKQEIGVQPFFQQQQYLSTIGDSTFLQHQTSHQTMFSDVVVKQEPSDDTMNLSGHFMCHPMFMMNHSPSSKCGCDLSKPHPTSHFLCANNKPGISVEDYGELLKRGSAALLGESQPKTFPPHQSIRSDKERPFSCDECGKSFLLKHHLVTHSRVHSGIRPFGCNECGKTFAHKHCLITHQRLHSGQRPYQCLECKKSFTLKHHLVTHARTHSKDRPFHCDECGKTFSQKRNLITHAKLHSGERPFQCSICGECFSQREHLLAHSRFHGGESGFVCSECGEAFARKFQLVDHRRLHGHSPYSCSICGKEFLQKRTLIAHAKLHEESSPYSCKHCNESYPRMSDLVAHSKIHNNFSCKECSCTFTTNESFVLHLQHHGHVSQNFQISSSSNNSISKPFSCPECGSGFAQKHGLVQHLNRKHSNKQPIQIKATRPISENATMVLTPSCDIMEHIKHQVLSEQLKAKIQ